MLEHLAHNIYDKKLKSTSELRVKEMAANNALWYQSWEEIIVGIIPYVVLVFRAELSTLDFIVYKAIMHKLKLL